MQNSSMHWLCDDVRFSLARPLLMGVVNVTPDSFSDGGDFYSPDDACARALALVEDGADIVDVGGESTRPGAQPVKLEEEKRRVFPVIEKLAARGVVVSLDSSKPPLMRAAADAGVKILNDVDGFDSPQALAAAADTRCGLVVMHKRGDPRTMQDAPRYDNVVAEVADYLKSRLDALMHAGVECGRLALDPGIGFGKTLEHNRALLGALPALGGQYPLAVGVSRKSMFSGVCDGADAGARDFASAVAAAVLAGRGANIFRVHNVALTRQALAAANLLAPEAGA